MAARFVDLHLHLDGSISAFSAKMIAQLSDMAEGALSLAELERRLTLPEGSQDLNDYLACFEVPLALLQRSDQIEEASFNLADELYTRDFAYVEIRFAPQLFCRGLLGQEEALKAVLRGLARSELDCQLILCAMRGRDTAAANFETIELAQEYLGKGVCAVDLAGAEALYPTHDYQQLFAYAKKLGLPMTLHAGEAAGPKSVWDALAMGPARIGHGVRSYEDKALLRELAAAGVCLELCPTSNLDTHIFSDYGELPLADFDEAGVKYCINSDNMSVSKTSVPEELAHLRASFGWDSAKELELSLAAADAAFLPENKKAKLKALLEKNWAI